jgi:hypothetical protein
MGSGSPAKEVQTSELPEWAKPYFERSLKRAESESLKPYEQYTGDRISKASDYSNIVAGQQGLLGVANSGGISGLGAAQDYSQYAMDQSKALGQYAPSQTSEYQFDPTRQFSGQEVQNYMNPYMQNVVNQQQDTAIKNFNRQNASRAQQGVGAGAFGGSRQGVVQGMAEEGLMGQLDQIQAKGLQDAYSQATSAFQADRSAQTATEASRAAEAARVQAQNEASNQFGASQGLAALNTGAQAAAAGSAYGQLERDTDIQNAQLLDTVGRSEQLEGQQGLDIQYQDYLAKQGFTQDQIGWMAGILQGQPVQNAGITTTVGTPATPGFGQQVLGAGLTGLSLYNSFANPVGAAATIAGSDMRLKENIKPAGTIGGFNAYTWDWNKEGKRVGFNKYPTKGVMAQEVLTKRPDLVVTDANGYYLVNYAGLV